MSEGPRTFVALPLPAAALDAFAALGDALDDLARARRVRLRRTAPDHLHITLKFLGATPTEQIESVSAVIDRVAVELNRESVRVSGWACFPRPARARVIALQLDAGTPQLARAARTLDEGLHELGFTSDDRDFRPHVTLARLGRPTDLRWLAGESAVRVVEFELDRLVWFESVLGGSGARYQVLREWGLGDH